MRINESEFSLIVLKCLLVALLVDIGGGFGIKYLAFLMVFAVCVIKLIRHGVSTKWWPEAAVLAYLLFSGSLSVAAGTPVGDVYGELSFLVFFFLLVLLRGISPARISSAMLQTISLGAVMIIGLFAMLYIVPDLALPMAEAGTERGLGYLGFRPGFLSLPNVYFRWSMWLVLGLALALAMRSLVPILLFGFAGILTTSTAIVAMLFLIPVLYIVAIEHRVKGLLLAAAGAGVLFIVVRSYLSLDPNIAGFLLSKFFSGSDSTSIKLGHIESVLQVVGNDWWVVLFGQGVGTSFFSSGVGKNVINVEVSHFNVLRQFGVMGVSLIIGYIAFVIFQLFRRGVGGKGWALGLGGMFLIAGTNPLLLSPVFFVPLLMARSYALEAGKLHAE